MSDHRYILEPYKGMNSRYHCPECQRKEKTFSVYIDTLTGEQVHQTVGRCNRESNCNYHYTPKQYFQDNKIFLGSPRNQNYPKANPKANPKPASYIHSDEFKGSLRGYENNNFVLFLTELFGRKVTTELVSRYFIATSKHWPGATIFWQIDVYGKIRTGKIMLYNAVTGKRVKEPFSHITWVHKSIQQADFQLKQCFFGEHLLIDKTKPVAIVESEKTAIIASIYLPGFIWLAAGSLNNLNIKTCSNLKGRRVSLFPDLKCFEKWSIKAKELSHHAYFNVSDLLERKATVEEREKGLDLADYLLQFDSRDFVLNMPEVAETEKSLILSPVPELKHISTRKLIYDFERLGVFQRENWLPELDELQKFFSGVTFPDEPIKLNQCSTIRNVTLFLETHFETAKANNGKPTFLPYLNRLKKLKENLNTQF